MLIEAWTRLRSTLGSDIHFELKEDEQILIQTRRRKTAGAQQQSQMIVSNRITAKQIYGGGIDSQTCLPRHQPCSPPESTHHYPLCTSCHNFNLHLQARLAHSSRRLQNFMLITSTGHRVKYQAIPAVSNHRVAQDHSLPPKMMN
jgi:hypothetical protein